MEEKLFFIDSKFGSYGLTVYLLVKANSLEEALVKGKIKDKLVKNFDKDVVNIDKMIQSNNEITFDDNGVSNYIGHYW